MATRWDLAVGALRETFSLIAEKTEGRAQILFESFKFLVDELRAWVADRSVVPADPHARAARDLLLACIDAGNTVSFEHYGAGLGTNDYNDFDVAVTFGDPWIHRGSALREARFAGRDFGTVYRAKVREEKAQVMAQVMGNQQAESVNAWAADPRQSPGATCQDQTETTTRR